MVRAVYSAFGAPEEVLALEPSDPVAPGPGEVRIAVERAPINPSDLLQIAGQYGVRPPLPATAGNEGIGRIAEAGDGVPLSPGQIVLLPAGTGTWQSSVTVSAQGIVPLPEADIDQLSMLAVNPATAYLLLDDIVPLAEGDWVIQSAANSAVGQYLIQLAKVRGLRTVNVVRRAELADELTALGADAVVVDGPDLAERVRAALGGGTPRLAVDAVGGETFARLGDALGKGGTLVSYGAMGAMTAEVPITRLIFADIRVRGFWLAPWFGTAGPDRIREVYTTLVGMIASGALKAPVEAVYPLSRVHDAVRHAARPGRSGKVLLAPSADD